MIQIIRSLGLLILLACCTWSCDQQMRQGRLFKPKNVILLIGDGMGLSQVSSSFYFQEKWPHFGRFPYVGLINTSSTSHKITDSAAAATAFSTGKKSYNGAIGVDADTIPHQTLVEMADDRNYKTALIATSSITHATPAAFYAHVPSRNQHEDIAIQLAHSSVGFFAGGGRDYFFLREDRLNYGDSLLHHGFQIDTSGLPAKGSLDPKQKYGYLLAGDGMPRMLNGRGSFLSDAFDRAIEYLTPQSEGFFMMAEGSQIDWGGHDNDVKYLVSELLDFDETIGRALDFAEKDGNTLVIVTADHETGGFALSSTPKGENSSDYNEITGTFSTGGHTTTLIPVFAYGPGAERFAGIYHNNEIFHKLTNLLGWESTDSSSHTQ